MQFIIYITWKEDLSVSFSGLYSGFGKAKEGIEEFLKGTLLKTGKEIIYVSKEELKKTKLSAKKAKDAFYVKKGVAEAVIYKRCINEGYISSLYYLEKVGRLGIMEFPIAFEPFSSEKILQQNVVKDTEEEKNREMENEEKVAPPLPPLPPGPSLLSKDADQIVKNETKVKDSYVTNYERGIHVSLIQEIKNEMVRRKPIDIIAKEDRLQKEKEEKKKESESKKIKFIEDLVEGKNKLRKVPVSEIKSQKEEKMKQECVISLPSFKIEEEDLRVGKENLRKVKKHQIDVNEMVSAIIQEISN